jgi:arylsulfatase A-like enzyme
MKTKTLLLLALALPGCATLFGQPKHNVLFIMTDQQSHRMMSCAGNQWLRTPHMDAIASRGYRFDKTYCANPVCMPSRFSLLTGHYASEVGVKENTSAYKATKVQQIIAKGALGHIFRQAGYQTLYSGKTHLYGTKDVSEYGFTLNSTDPYDGPAIYAEKVLAEIGQAKSARPFFLFLSFLNPHDICYKAGTDKRFPEGLPEANARETVRLLAVQKKLSAAEYRRQIPPRAANRAPISDEVPAMVEMDVGSRTWDDAQWDLYNWMYHRLTESVDAQIGRVLTALRQAGLEENTIVVLTSDHGDMNGAHGLTLKNVMFEECQRVPLIFAGKGIAASVVDPSTLVCNGLDFLPTICDLAGIKSPPGLPGISLKPWLTGAGTKTARRYIVTEDYNAYQIHDGRHKFTIYELPGNPETLTDLETNPGETINFARDPSYARIREVLKTELMANLAGRGLTPLPQDRAIDNVRALETKKSNRKGRAKVKAEIDQ